jgi:hypothetical protein
VTALVTCIGVLFLRSFVFSFVCLLVTGVLTGYVGSTTDDGRFSLSSLN